MKFNPGRLCAFFIAFVLSLVGTVANAATYYVSTSGSDAAACTSDGVACLTVSGALAKAANGDTIYLNRGNTFTPSDYINVNKSVTFDAYGSGAKPIVTGTVGYTVPPDQNKGMFHVAATNVSINNIRIEYPSGPGIRVEAGSDGFVSDGVEVSYAGLGGIKMRLSNNQTVRNCLIEYDNQKYLAGEITDWAGGVYFQGVIGGLVDNCVINKSGGEGIGAFFGSYDITIRNNTVYGAKAVGIYLNAVVGATVENNVVYGTTDTDYHRGTGYVGDCYGFANERYQYDSQGLDTTIYTRDVTFVNNVGAFCKMGLSIYASAGTPFDNYVNTLIAHNIFVDNGTQIRPGGDHTNTKIQNNIFLSLTGGTVDYASPASSGVTYLNNAWSTQPANTALRSAGDLAADTDTVTLTKMTGWQSLAALNAVTIADFIPTGSSDTLGAGSATYTPYAYVSDFYGNGLNSPPDLGAVQDGSTPVDPPAYGSSITSLSATIAASTADYTATGTELSGVYSALITDGVDSQALTGVIGKANGTEFVFDTGTLTGIDLDNYTITATLDTPAYINFTPRSWTGANVTNTSNATQYWIFDAAANITTTSGSRASIGTLSGVVVGDELEINLYVVGDAATVANFKVQDTGSAHSAVYAANPTSGSMTQNSNNLFSGTPTINKTVEKGVTTFTITGIAAYTSDYSFLLGTGNDPDNLVALGLLVYKNKSPKTVDYVYQAVTAPTITNVNGDDVLVPNSENTLTGTGLSQLKSITLSNAGGSITYPVVVGQDTSAKFRVADLTGLNTGETTLTAKYGKLIFADYNPRVWANNYGGTLTDYTTTALGLVTATTITSGGAIWNGAIYNSAFDGVAGQTITAHFITEPGSSSRFRAVISNQTTGEYIEAAGIYGGGITATGSPACNSSSVSEIQVNDQIVVAVTCELKSTGPYKLVVGPYHTSGDVHFYGVAIWSGSLTSTVTLSPVTKTADGSPEPTLVKKIKFNATHGRLKRGGALFSGTFGNLKIYSELPWKDPAATLLAHAQNLTVSSGVLTAVEADLTTGSINALESAKDYAFVAYDDDNDPFAFGYIQITVE